MKKYSQFINENSAKGELDKKLPIGFRFSIDFSSEETLLGNEKLRLVMEEMKKYFYFKNNYIFTYQPNDGKPWAWTFEISVSGDYAQIEFWPITSPKSNFIVTDAGVKFLENMVTVDEFLEYGFEGIKNFIRMKKDASKYNL